MGFHLNNNENIKFTYDSLIATKTLSQKESTFPYKQKQLLTVPDAQSWTFTDSRIVSQ